MLLPLLRHLGPRWLAQRALLAAERRLGLLARRLPSRPWLEFGPADADAAAFVRRWRTEAPALPLARLDRAWLAPHLEGWAVEAGHSPVAEADALAHGRMRVFSHELVDLGFPPAWHRNALTGRELDPAAHWTRLSDAGRDDIKGVWEASRFTWAQVLVRAWIADGEPRHVDLFWRLFEDWIERNPPNRGPNWMCGQEAALRLISFTFALQAFRHHPATTDRRLILAARFADATARRIAGHLDYALSQGNNHGVSEALGLVTAAAFWPALPEAAAWRRRGLAALESQVTDLVAADGGFSQHSTNYHRLFLQLMTWAELTERAAGRTLPAAVRGRVLAAVRFLAALMESDGRVPRYGADDGARLFALSACDYGDFRPAVGAALALFAGERLPAGAWDEESLLLLGPVAPSAVSVGEGSVDFPLSGVTLLRHLRGAAFFRAPTVFRHRPSHADHLHVSLRWDGEWITEDPGTYSYNAPGVLNGLAAARYHNVVTVDDRDPMRRVGRFLWLPWPVCRRVPTADGVRARHEGYGDFTCDRAVRVFPHGFVIIDRVTGARPGACTLRWHGPSRSRLGALTLACSAPAEETWLTADEATGEGWYSEHYGQRTPAWSRRLTAVGADVLFVTALGCDIRLDGRSLWVDGEQYPLG